MDRNHLWPPPGPMFSSSWWVGPRSLPVASYHQLSPCRKWLTAGPPGGRSTCAHPFPPNLRVTRPGHAVLQPLLQSRKWFREHPAPFQGSRSQHPFLPPPRLLSKILSECEDADEIEYLVDGSWCPIRAEKERSCSPQCPILVLGEASAGLCPSPCSCQAVVISEFDVYAAMWPFT